jgi:hypothetical protein
VPILFLDVPLSPNSTPCLPLCRAFPTIASNYKQATPPLYIAPLHHRASYTAARRPMNVATMLPSPQATTTTCAMILAIWTQNNPQHRHPCAMHLAVALPQNPSTSTVPAPTHRFTTSAEHCTTTLPYPAQEARSTPPSGQGLVIDKSWWELRPTVAASTLDV